MSEDMVALGRRALACKHWRWMPGMLIASDNGTSPLRVAEVGDGGMVSRGLGWTCPAAWHRPGYPDLSDPATIGCLDHIVDAAWAPHADASVATGPVVVRSRWVDGRRVAWRVVYDDGGQVLGEGATRAEALVAALEAAP